MLAVILEDTSSQVNFQLPDCDLLSIKHCKVHLHIPAPNTLLAYNSISLFKKAFHQQISNQEFEQFSNSLSQRKND